MMGECRRSVQVVYALPDRQRVVDVELPAEG